MIPNSKIYCLFFNLFFISTFLLFSCPTLGQEQQKRNLSEADYGRWGTLWTKGISDFGNWTSFAMTYENHLDTLFLKNTTTNKTYSFPKGNEGHFGTETIFACLLPTALLQVVELHSGKTYVFANVVRYELLMNGKYILTSNKGRNERSELKIRTPTGVVTDTLADVTNYVSNYSKNSVLYTTQKDNQSTIGIINLKEHSKRIIAQSNDDHYQQLTWQDNGKAIAFLKQTNNNLKPTIVQYYRISDKRLFTLKTIGDKDEVSLYDGLPLSITENGEQVFCWATAKKPSEAKQNKSTVEIWNGTDKQLYPSKEKERDAEEQPKLCCWYPLSNQFSLVSSDALPQKRLSPKQEYALLSNQYQYGLENNYYELVDYYLKNIKTGTAKLLLQRQSHDPNQIGFAANGNTILYYRDKNWWMYNIDKDTHYNCTQTIPTPWDNSSTNAPHQLDVYGIAGWSTDGKKVLLYDEYDIWSVAIDGSVYTRLTQGREKQITFRIAPLEYESVKIANYDGKASVVFDLSKDLILEAKRHTDYATGYFILTSKGKLKKIVFDTSKITDLHQTKAQKESFIYTTQRFDESPKLVCTAAATQIPKVLFESNQQQKEYYYGKSELVSYCNSKGESLKGALFYPAHYDTSR